jgi:antitoxin YxxD
MITRQSITEEKDRGFYPVTEDEILEVEKTLGFSLPAELKEFYRNIGYGFFKGSEYNVNRFMDPYSICDFRLRQNEYESYPEIEVYDDFEDNKLIFFESDTYSLISIELTNKEKSKIFYYNTIIADSLEEFIKKIQEDDSYFVGMLK